MTRVAQSVDMTLWPGRWRLISIVAAAVLAVVPETGRAQTNGYLLPCSAGALLGRGCTLMPGTAEPATLLSHPAGLAAGDGRALSVNFAAFLPLMDYTNAVNPVTAGADIVYPIPAVFYADRARGKLRLGAGVQTVGGMGADYQLTHALLGSDRRYRSKFGLMKGGLAAAYRASPQLALGVTVGVLYGQLDFTTPYAVSPSQLAGLAGLAQDPDYAPMLQNFTEATAYAEMTGLSGVAFTAGASVEFRPSDRLAVALAYTPRTTLTFGGSTAQLDMNTQFGQLYQGMVAAKSGDTATVNAQLAGLGINPALGMASDFSTEADFGVPQTLTLAVGVRPSARWGLGLDAGWIGWKDAFADFPVRLSGGTNPNVNIVMNGDPSNGDFADSWPLAWKNSWFVRAGAQYAATPTLVLRGGLLHGSNPVPSQTLFTIFPAIVRTSATLGFSYQLGATQVSATYAHTFEAEQQASSPHLVASEYANSISRLAERTLAFGLGWRF
jgi:long-subunit fatty acid transport protein